MGAGSGEVAEAARVRRRVGVDIFRPYLVRLRRSATYEHLVCCDARSLPFRDGSFDVVLSSQTIEHVTGEDGTRLLNEMERVARLAVVVGTPMGPALPRALDGNEHQEHLSAWWPEDFARRGYTVRGQGLKLVWGDDGFYWRARSRVSKGIAQVASYLASPLAWVVPRVGAQMVAVKRHEPPRDRDA